MKRRHIWLIAALVLLSALNVLQRMSDGKDQGALATSSGNYQPLDFRLMAGSTRSARDSLNRDIFAQWSPPPPPPKRVEIPAEPPPKSAEELAEDAVRAELEQVKVVGVVFHGMKGQAYLVKGDQAFLVVVGEKVDGRFDVQRVSTESVVLEDPNTKVRREIPVSG